MGTRSCKRDSPRTKAGLRGGKTLHEGSASRQCRDLLYTTAIENNSSTSAHLYTIQIGIKSRKNDLANER